MGSCLTLSNELPRETHVLIKQQNDMGKRHPGREQQGKATQEKCSATELTVPGLTVMGVVSGLFLANQGPSWWLMQCSIKMDSRKLFPAGGGLLVHVPHYDLLS